MLHPALNSRVVNIILKRLTEHFPAAAKLIRHEVQRLSLQSHSEPHRMAMYFLGTVNEKYL